MKGVHFNIWKSVDKVFHVRKNNNKQKKLEWKTMNTSLC